MRVGTSCVCEALPQLLLIIHFLESYVSEGCDWQHVEQFFGCSHGDFTCKYVCVA
jgi:hypothetical protein